MEESLSLEKDKIVEENIIKDITNLFRLNKENKSTKYRIIWDIRNLFKLQEKGYYIPVRVANYWSNNYIEHESNAHRNKKLSVEEYLNKIRQYLKD